jgi:hypothetical protein
MTKDYMLSKCILFKIQKYFLSLTKTEWKGARIYERKQLKLILKLIYFFQKI